MKASDLFVKCLENEGVEYIFGLPGEENADVMMSLKRSSIKFVLCSHEQTVAFMADGNMDRTPLVVITGQADTKRMHKESHQAMNVVDMFKPLTKWARQIIHPDNISEVVRKAFKLAETEKPGACHIELPEDIAKQESNNQPVPFHKLRYPAPDEKIIDQAIALIEQAKRPVILAGNGAIRKRASQQLKQFAENLGIPVFNTFMGKGALSRTDPHCLFTVGLQAKDYALHIFEQADLVITVGYDLVEYHPRSWNIGQPKKILHIDFLPAEVDQEYPVEVEIGADIANALWQLNERLGQGSARFDISVYAETRARILADLAEHKDDTATGALKPQKVLSDVRQFLGPADILLSDVGAHKMWIARYYQCDEPNTCLISNGFCSMGFALPGAPAAKLVYPERKVLAICGDAGVLMNIQDLETARRLGLNIVIMIWEDHEYRLIKWKQQIEFGEHSDLTFSNPDWCKLAEAFDCKGLRCDDSTQLGSVLAEAFAADRPVLLAIPIDYRENMKLTEPLGTITCRI